MTRSEYRQQAQTSKEAAEKLQTAQRNRAMALEFIFSRGEHGATIDEVCVFISGKLGREVPPNAISGRFGELEKNGFIYKNGMTRKTRCNRSAFVYLHQSASRLLEFKKQQCKTGHGHVFPRFDGHKERCGGPVKCKECKQVKSYIENMEKKYEQK